MCTRTFAFESNHNDVGRNTWQDYNLLGCNAVRAAELNRTSRRVLCEVTAVRTSNWLFKDAASKLYTASTTGLMNAE
jgi:hypothetical protein